MIVSLQHHNRGWVCGICTGRAAWGTVQLRASAAMQSAVRTQWVKFHVGIAQHNTTGGQGPLVSPIHPTLPSSSSSSSSEAGEGDFGTAWRPIATPRRIGREPGKRDPSVGVPVLQIALRQSAGGLHARALVSYLFPGNASLRCPPPPPLPPQAERRRTYQPA